MTFFVAGTRTRHFSEVCPAPEIPLLGCKPHSQCLSIVHYAVYRTKEMSLKTLSLNPQMFLENVRNVECLKFLFKKMSEMSKFFLQNCSKCPMSFKNKNVTSDSCRHLPPHSIRLTFYI